MPFVTEILESFIRKRYGCDVVTLCPQDYYPEERDCFVILHPVFSDTIYVIVRDGVDPCRANTCKLIRFYKRHGYDCRGFMERDSVSDEQLYCMTSCVNFRKHSHHDSVMMREIMKCHIVPCHYTLTHYKCKDNKHYCMIYAGGILIAKACWVSARRCCVDFRDGRKMEFTADPMLTEHEHVNAKDISTFVDAPMSSPRTDTRTMKRSEKYPQGPMTMVAPVPLTLTGNRSARSASNIVKPSSYKRTMRRSVEDSVEPSISFEEEDVYVVPSSRTRSKYLQDAEEIPLRSKKSWKDEQLEDNEQLEDDEQLEEDEQSEDEYEEFETTQSSPSRRSNLIEVRENGSLYDAPPSSDKSVIRTARSKPVPKPKSRTIQFRSSTIV